MPFEVIDLFCGVGELTYGMRQAGFRMVARFDNDQTCEKRSNQRKKLS